MKTKRIGKILHQCKKRFNLSLTNWQNYIKLYSLGGENRGGRTLVRFFISLALIFVIRANMGFTDSYIGAEWNPTGNPIGGGPGYSDSIRHQDADFIVTNKSELLNALNNATYGDIIYVMDNAEINMKGVDVKSVKQGVTLASGRGRTLADTISWGALIYDDSVHSRNELFSIRSNARVTGLRLRGCYNELDGGVDGSDTCGVLYLFGVGLNDHGAELDNCEIWGFRRNIYTQAGNNDTIYIHHNYFHEGPINDVYHILVGSSNNTRYVIAEANYFDYGRAAIMGTIADIPKFEFRYNITGEHGVYNQIDQHGVNEQNPPTSCAADWIHHNTVKGTYNYVDLGVWVRGDPVDSFWINNNWFYADDSASAVGFSYGTNYSYCRIWNNAFTTTPPTGVDSRIPTANIFVDVDSGDAPLTVKFNATNSSGGSGGYELRAFYWRFGDNYHARFTDSDDSISHTYNTIGVYKAELMVTNDLGIDDKAYVDINVAPTDGRNYLSFWIKDNKNWEKTGYFFKQCLVNGNVLWEQDVAGYEGWEHIVLDITDSISNMDSVDITFRLYCKIYNSGLLDEKLRVAVDDVHLYGGHVVNGDFESGTWTGGEYNRSDGYWIGSHHGSRTYLCECAMYVNSGIRAFWLQAYEGTINAGDYAQVTQKVAMTGLGVDNPPGNESGEVCSLYVPYPNPSGSRFTISYQLAARSRVSMKIFDVSGRLVRTLVDEEEEEVGEYQVHWDGTDSSARPLANGVYFCKFWSGDFTATRKLVILR
jgi:PKD repeat protein